MTQIDAFRADPRLEYVGGLRIPGQPTPARREIKKGKHQKHASAVWSAAYRAWKHDATRALQRWRRSRPVELQRRMPFLSCALVIECTFILRRPQDRPVYHVDGVRTRYPLDWTDDRRPHLGTTDTNNLAKGPPDAMVAARILQDDRWQFSERNSKWYAAVGESPATIVRFWTYNEQ